MFSSKLLKRSQFFISSQYRKYNVQSFKEMSNQYFNRIYLPLSYYIPEVDKDYIKYNFDKDESNMILGFGSKGTFIVSRKDFENKIFLSSPISGSHHYYFDNGKFVSKTDSNDELLVTLKKEIDSLFSCDINFEELEKKYIAIEQADIDQQKRFLTLPPEIASFEAEGTLEGLPKSFMDRYLK
eukprot:gene5806-9629_t